MLDYLCDLVAPLNWIKSKRPILMFCNESVIFKSRIWCKDRAQKLSHFLELYSKFANIFTPVASCAVSSRQRSFLFQLHYPCLYPLAHTTLSKSFIAVVYYCPSHLKWCKHLVLAHTGYFYFYGPPGFRLCAMHAQSLMFSGDYLGFR